jgi:hypothetical protein
MPPMQKHKHYSIKSKINKKKLEISLPCKPGMKYTKTKTNKQTYIGRI